MVLIFLLGFPFEWIEICLIVLPVFAPISPSTISPIIWDTAALSWPGSARWLQSICRTSFMSPPFGATLFYLKGTVPPGVTMSDVYRAMYPFVALQVVGLVLCIYYPGIVLWLPRLGRLPRRARRGLRPGRTLSPNSRRRVTGARGQGARGASCARRSAHPRPRPDRERVGEAHDFSDRTTSGRWS